jgi:hypothetical protein
VARIPLKKTFTQKIPLAPAPAISILGARPNTESKEIAVGLFFENSKMEDDELGISAQFIGRML